MAGEDDEGEDWQGFSFSGVNQRQSAKSIWTYLNRRISVSFDVFFVLAGAASSEAASSKVARRKSAPIETTPREGAPREGAPRKGASREGRHARGRHARGRHAKGRYVRGRHARGRHARPSPTSETALQLQPPLGPANVIRHGQ